MATLFCSFNSTVGWRVVKSTEKTFRKIGVFHVGLNRYLSIPATAAIKNGRFCNPTKHALNFFLIERFLTMLNTTTNTVSEEMKLHFKDIDKSNPDYYQWGINTRLVCGDDLKLADSVFADSGIIDSSSARAFWDGYNKGIAKLSADLDSICVSETTT